ncbi:MAG: recombinase RecT [Chlamydiales bacterium]
MSPMYLWKGGPSSGNWVQKAYCSAASAPVCAFQIDANKGKWMLQPNKPLDNKVWRAAHKLLIPHGFIWEPKSNQWTAASTEDAEKIGLEAKQFIETTVANSESSDIDSPEEQEKIFKSWADVEDSFALTYVNRKDVKKTEAEAERSALFLKLSSSQQVTVEPPRTEGSNSAQELEAFLSSVSDTIDKLLPSHIDNKRFKLLLSETLSNQENLFALEMASIRKTVFTAALFGLEPHSALKQCYFLPIAGKLRFVIGYQGLIDLAIRTGNVQFFTAKCVYKEDCFAENTQGLIQHVPHPSAEERGPLTCVYAICFFKNGDKKKIVLPEANFKRLKKISHSLNNPNSPWFHWGEEMYLKTTLKRFLRDLHLDTERRL